MKFFLIAIIKIYWAIIPKSKRRKCIFRLSCSKFVYSETKEKGVLKGVTALSFRIKNCNNNFDIYLDPFSNKRKMLLQNGITIDEDEIASFLIPDNQNCL
jgi:putative component of membrane protein insertase Oxa1/YidC/SpoIIIJ protein YidD